MKNILALATVIGLLNAAPTSAAGRLALDCVGSLAGVDYAMQIYQGYGYEAQIDLQKAERSNCRKLSVPARGGSFSECGSRRVPCDMIDSIQYSSENPSMIFTMISSTGKNVGTGGLDIAPHGFGQPGNFEVKMNCQKF